MSAEDANAFPYREQDNNGQYRDHFGLTMRDYFAAAALPSILSYSNDIRAKADTEFAIWSKIDRPYDKNDDNTDSEHLSYRAMECATASYIIADAMLAARKEKA